MLPNGVSKLMRQRLGSTLWLEVKELSEVKKGNLFQITFDDGTVMLREATSEVYLDQDGTTLLIESREIKTTD